MFNLYKARGFVPQWLLGDGDFQCARDAILPATLNICGAGKHVPEIERGNRTLKERTRATVHSLPFTYFPRTLLKSIVIWNSNW